MNLDHASIWTHVPRRLQRLCIQLNRQYYKRRPMEAVTDVFHTDWDLLIILDAARPDMLKEAAPEWRIETKKSPGTESWEFMKKTFLGREFHDTVYLTANPHAEKLPSGIFHSYQNLLEKAWDEERKTVLPSEMVTSVLTAVNEYPNKRLIAHFMQPHFPFLGETGQQLRQQGLRNDDSPHPWVAAMFCNSIEVAELRKAYRENHEVVVPYVDRLVSEFDGKTVVTADHANLIGERGRIVPIRLFGHPGNFPHPNLRTVPWVEFDSTSRRQVIEEPPEEPDSLANSIIDDRLESLGYR